jgi:hypothetical protein
VLAGDDVARVARHGAVELGAGADELVLRRGGLAGVRRGGASRRLGRGWRGRWPGGGTG